MKKIGFFLLMAAAASMIAACGGAGENKPANTANANTSGAVGPPTVEALKALETKAFEAWKNKDGKFFEGFLTDKFAMSDEKGKRLDKASTVKMIAEHKCDVKSFSFSDEKMTKVGPVTAVITMKVTTDGTCEGQKMPSPVISASLYVRNGTEWKGAWHAEVPVVDPKAPPAAPAKADDKKAPAPPAKAEDKKDAGTKPANANTAAAKPAADTETDALMAAEKAGWEAWKARDPKALGGVVTNDITFVDVLGAVSAGRDACIKAWTEPKCDIKSVNVTDGSSVSVTGDTSLLFFKGTATGTCDGQKLGPLWGTTVYVKEGTAWKAAFIFESPA